MTRIAWIGDPHVASFSRHGGPKVAGVNERGRMTLAVLDSAFKTASIAGAEYAVVLGDLFDSMRPEPQLIHAVRVILRAAVKRGLRIVLLKGNHDSGSDTPKDTALYAVEENGVRIVDQPQVMRLGNEGVCLIPFRAGAVIDWLPELLDELQPPAACILAMHAGVKDQETAPWLQSAPDAIELAALSSLMDQWELNYAFMGNWHDHRVWEDLDVHQVGALSPTGFSNLGIDGYGKVAISGGEGVRYETVEGPRFLKLGSDESPAKLAGSPHTLFVEWRVTPERFEDAKATLAAAIEAKEIHTGSVLPDNQGVREGLTDAAVAARAAVGLGEAISAYVAELKLPPHLRKESIEARVRGYMGA